MGAERKRDSNRAFINRYSIMGEIGMLIGHKTYSTMAYAAYQTILLESVKRKKVRSTELSGMGKSDGPGGENRIGFGPVLDSFPLGEYGIGQSWFWSCIWSWLPCSLDGQVG